VLVVTTGTAFDLREHSYGLFSQEAHRERR
jgi:hypothetical protein